MRPAITALLFASVLTSGCHPHVQLQAPDTAAPPEVRMQAFSKLRPISMQQTQHYQVGRYGGVAYVGTSTDYMQIADGTRVYHAEDILPVVPPDSPAARAADASASASSTASTLTGIGWGIGSIGAVVMLLPLMQSPDYSAGESLDLTLLWVGLGVMMIGMVMVLISMPYRATANDEAATAYRTYEDALLARLALCVTAGQIGPCGYAPPAVAAPPTATPPPGYGGCLPDCRSGFDCIQGRCMPACNPVCPFGQECSGHGASATCVPATMTPQPQQLPPAPPPTTTL